MNIMERSFREEMPVLADSNIAYFDYAATTFMPRRVMNKWFDFHNTSSVFISRGNNLLSSKAEYVLQKSEEIFRGFFKFNNNYEFIYSKNVTEAINIMAYSIEKSVKELDIILIGPYEHHSNYLPWKYLAMRTGALFFEMPVDKNGDVDYSYIERYRNRIKIVSISSVSNAFGYSVDIQKICSLISEDAFLFVDQSQLCAHAPICSNDKISAHFIPSHKMYGPKNIALTVVKKDVLDCMEPVIMGGGMVESVGYADYWIQDRKKFFPGTMDIGLISSFASACGFIDEISYDFIKEEDQYYSKQVIELLDKYGYDLVLRNENCVNYVISFSHEILHAHDINEYLSNKNIIIRSGNMCTQNSLRKIDKNAINRISLGVGVCENDVKMLKKGLEEILL